jgi:hypothetical protein
MTDPDAALSPSLQRREPGVDTFEVKYLVDPTTAAAIRAFAAAHLQPDVHADPAIGDGYDVTTTYLDTPDFAIARRLPGVGGRKYRVRRYGDANEVHLERKSRRGDRVRKIRTAVPIDDAPRRFAAELGAEGPFDGDWFLRQTRWRGLVPTCALRYRRVAYFGVAAGGPMRLTMDTEIRGSRCATVVPVLGDDALAILRDAVICELKFRAAMPAPFVRLVSELRLAPSSVSKYRRIAAAWEVPDVNAG